MGILLTDREILASMGTNSVDCLDCGMSIGKFKKANKAQLKKVVIELKKRVVWVQGNPVISFADADWQVLLKEVE